MIACISAIHIHVLCFPVIFENQFLSISLAQLKSEFLCGSQREFPFQIIADAGYASQNIGIG